jgi:FkbM family methyltransferase
MVPLTTLAELIKAADRDLKLTMLEIGAAPYGRPEKEPFRELLDAFPGSQIVAFELDKQLCAEMNRTAPRGIRYYPAALGRRKETRPLYEAMHPMCTSLYKPNAALLSCYNNLDDMILKTVSSVDTLSLDQFTGDAGIKDVDFIKIDIQGAELEVFQGGTRTLRDAVAIVSEVEFVPLYIGQPLFGDVCRFLSEEGLMFHKSLGVGGRTVRPAMINNDPNFVVQHLWADAMYIRDLLRLPELTPPKLLKLSLLSHVYDSPDLTYYCLDLYDRQCGTNVLQGLLER